MAFTANHNASDRTRTAIIVTLVEAAAIYAVVTGLTTTFTPERITILRGTNIPVPPKPLPSPPPDHTKVRDQHKDQTIRTPENPFTDLNSGTIDTLPIKPQPQDPVLPPVDLGTKPSHPAFAAISAHPRGHPGDWVTPNDYPSQDLREGNQGVVRFRLDIDARGKVTGCTVTASSGFPRLDAAACAKLSARGRFDPASDENGAKVAGSYASAVRWTIPD